MTDGSGTVADATGKPNIVYILADDMGYGDMRRNNADGKIPTPNLDRLARQGMRFTDAHAGSSVCTPSRYSLLTGCYAWRSRLKSGIVWPWDGSLIEPGRPTVASLLRDSGYRTACIGKWHLGWDWPTHDGRHPNDTLRYGVLTTEENAKREAFAENVDFAGRIRGGPVDHGFDTYFGVDVPNFPPYAWFADDRLTQQPTEQKPPEMYGRNGPAVPGWSLEEMVPEFTRRAAELIEAHATPDTDPEQRPLFLYLPLTSPHSPIVPNAQFRGKSGIGAYGDFVCEVDWVVGEVMDALERAGASDNTLLIFASDNGPEDHTKDDEGAYQRIRATGHASMGPLRGIKRDAWEGGHRVPMLARWPRIVPASTSCDQIVCLSDLMATCADIVGATHDTAEDSVSMLPLLRGRVDEPTRDDVIHHSETGTFAIRHGRWVFIDAPTGDENGEPADFARARGYQPHDFPGELYDIDDDLLQRRNRYGERPDVVDMLSARLSGLVRG
ncbi:arylsulfatase A-like enzyme [Haloactinopolyspora alba]|uniref:Arylsulfatase A-like enzyme n=1 Tax=Haloactinopolyspora alba TaxID=648780 RepID=A0A2P8E716_9ACTN|nr:arylsulfatase [Haloactinopolyspora alba]PSL05261.1 arylsulfatase A-like enzyme [Haloactinopolyspora alba]